LYDFSGIFQLEIENHAGIWYTESGQHENDSPKDSLEREKNMSGHEGHKESEHEHEHEHGHGHGHSHSRSLEGVSGARLICVMLLNFLITAAEVAGGILSGSLSLVSDALHNLSDGLSVIISYYAIKVSERQGDAKKTFGYRRASIMAALLNSSVLIGISLFLFKEAYDKFIHPTAVNGSLVIWVALISLVANFLSMLLLRKGSRGDLNIKATYIHLLSDTLSSLGVILAGVLILFFKVYWVDPLLTVLISLYILWECVAIFRTAINILMQGVPEDIDVGEIETEVKEIAGIEGLHHVHIWCLDENHVNFEAHVNVADMSVSCAQAILTEVEKMLGERYGINHVTLQFEAGGIGDSCPAGGECPFRVKKD
jgi:cobalt-zinc-cadmium efflux system protein